MAARMSEARRRAFFAALAATGNQTIAAERARVSRSWVRLHRTRDPAFRQAIDEAVATARAELVEAGGNAPPTGWGSLDGEELTVRGGNGRRVQVMRVRLDAFSARVEARFLAVVASTCNVLAACAAVGISPAAVYRQRQRRRDFAERWDRAIATGYDRPEIGLLQRCGSLFAEEEIDPGLADGLVAGPITVEQASGQRRARPHAGRHSAGSRPSFARPRALVLVGSFCCPVLPVPLESASVARCGPTALSWSNLRP